MGAQSSKSENDYSQGCVAQWNYQSNNDTAHQLELQSLHSLTTTSDANKQYTSVQQISLQPAVSNTTTVPSSATQPTPTLTSSQPVNVNINDTLTAIQSLQPITPLPIINDSANSDVSKYPLSIGIPLIGTLLIGGGIWYGMKLGQSHSKSVQSEIDEIIEVNKNAKTFKQMHPSQIRFTSPERLPSKPITEAERQYALRKTIHAINISTAIVLGTTLLAGLFIQYKYDIHSLNEFVTAMNQYTQSTHTSNNSYMKQYVYNNTQSIANWLSTTRLGRIVKQHEPNPIELKNDENRLYATFEGAIVLQNIQDQRQQK